MTIWHIWFTSRIPLTTDTHSEYAIVTVFLYIKRTNVMQLGSMFICNCNIAVHGVYTI